MLQLSAASLQMKKTVDNKGQGKSFGGFWNKKPKNGLEFEMKEKGIRHVEDAASFLNEVDTSYGEYGKAEDMLDMWGLGEKDASVIRKRKSFFIGFGIAVAVTVLIIASVFYILPAVLPEFFKGTNIELFVEKPVDLIYNDSFMVVGKDVCDIMSAPTPSSDRVTQVLYNEPIQCLAIADNDYLLVKTMDAVTGYIKRSDLVEGTESIEPDLHEYKLIVSDTSKNIMTHASQGTLITQVMMNTVLYADVKRDGVYQVALPGGGTGWIGSSGVIEISPRSDIEEVSCRYFVSSALSFVNSMYKDDGVTMRGMSVNGLVYVCSCVNGIPAPRTVEEQMNMGVEVELQYDVVTGKLITDYIIPGDIIFFESDREGVPYDMAVCTDTGTLLMVSSSGTTIKLTSFDPDSELCNRIVSVRRVFSQ
ncbi:MAG: SH3 domain-containing protein [Saccharofermentans sp.]|nr:SH3 domain-containing protein [Saccharofermentans sp.]